MPPEVQLYIDRVFCVLDVNVSDSRHEPPVAREPDFMISLASH